MARGVKGCVLVWLALVVGAAIAGCGSGGATSASPSATLSPVPSPSPTSTAATAPSPDDVKAFVDEAVAFAGANGKEAALAAFTAPGGQFHRDGMYVFAYDFGGTVIAHGGDATLVGKNLIDMTDPNGLRVIRHLVRLARGGGGWLYYMWGDPEKENSQQPKLGYVRKVDDTWFLGSGTYGPAATKPPSQAEVKAFVDEAWAYAKKVGREKAVAAFMDKGGPWFRGQLYVFGDTYDGTVVCFPTEPKNIGTNLWDRVDPDGVHPIREMAKLARAKGVGWVTYKYQDPTQGGRVRIKHSYVRAVDDEWFLGAGTYEREK